MPLPAPGLRHLFSVEGEQALRMFAQSNCLMAFDFDGTLAPIVADPNKAVLTTDVRILLERASLLFPVCVISGRSRDDVARRLPPTIPIVIGNHGIEAPSSLMPSDADVEEMRQTVHHWRSMLENELSQDEGVVIEDKALSLSVHYRHSPLQFQYEEKILNLAKDLKPTPRLVRGKFVVNVLPQSSPHKGTALLHLMARDGFERAIFVGDDHTDEDVFELNNDNILKIRVGAETNTHATFFLEDQIQIATLLAKLIELRQSTSVS